MTSPLLPDAEQHLDICIGYVLMGKSGPWPLPSRHRDLLWLLRRHKGAEQACQISAITERLGMQPREIKGAVKSLVEDFGIPIGASRQEPYGYFLCVTEDDVKAALRPLTNELISIARRVRALGGQTMVEQIFGQLPLELQKGARNA